MKNTDAKNLSFPLRIKAESDGYSTLSKEYIEKHKAREIGIQLRLAKKLGRAITDKEMRCMNVW